LVLLIVLLISAEPMEYGLSAQGWGTAGFSVSGVGIYGSSNTNYGAFFQSSTGTGLYAGGNSGSAAYFNGNVYVNGTLNKGSVGFVQPHPENPSREVVYAAFEGPEHAVFHRGIAHLKNGEVVIEMPDYFSIVAAEEGITVQFTPRSAESKGLAAVKVNRDRIEVKELFEGKGSYEFDFFITAKRAGFERHEPIQNNTHFNADNMSRGEFEARYSRDEMSIKLMRDLLISNGILTPEGKLNIETAARLGWTVKEGEFASAPESAPVR
jgi:hypothetical protein